MTHSDFIRTIHFVIEVSQGMEAFQTIMFRVIVNEDCETSGLSTGTDKQETATNSRNCVNKRRAKDGAFCPSYPYLLPLSLKIEVVSTNDGNIAASLGRLQEVSPNIKSPVFFQL